MTEPSAVKKPETVDAIARHEAARPFDPVIAYDDVLIFPLVELGPANSAGQMQRCVTAAKTLFKPTGIVITGCDLSLIAIEEVRVANQSQAITSSGGAGGPSLPAELFAQAHAGLMPWAMDTCQANNQASVMLRNLDPERTVRPRVMFLGQPTDIELSAKLRGGVIAATDTTPQRARRATPVMLYPHGRNGDERCPPGETIDLIAHVQQEFAAVHLLLTAETAGAFDVIDISTSTEQRPPRVCREPRPGSLFAPSSPVRVTLRMPTISSDQSIVVTLKNVSDRPVLARGALWGHAIY
ncbi:MAG: hypothetical protein ACHREM_04660 [Polyangiales bacterium]